MHTHSCVHSKPQLSSRGSTLQAKADEVSSLCREGAGVLESLQDLLEEVSPRREAQANTVQYRPSVG